MIGKCWELLLLLSLRKNCPNKKFFWTSFPAFESVFSQNPGKYGHKVISNRDTFHAVNVPLVVTMNVHLLLHYLETSVFVITTFLLLLLLLLSLLIFWIWEIWGNCVFMAYFWKGEYFKVSFIGSYLVKDIADIVEKL